MFFTMGIDFAFVTDFSDYELGYESSPEALSGLSTVALSEVSSIVYRDLGLCL